MIFDLDLKKEDYSDEKNEIFCDNVFTSVHSNFRAEYN